MNFIKHYREVMTMISEDERLHPTHVSLYVSLFTMWNQNHFENPFSINRDELMGISKIGSKHTYHKCLKQLNEFGYLRYHPSHNPLKGSLVHMFNFSTGDEQAVAEVNDKTSTSNEQPLHPSLNNINSLNNKHNLKQTDQDSKKNNTEDQYSNKSSAKKSLPPDEAEVLTYFKSKQYPQIEAHKFYNYFQSVGWKVGKNKPMKDWKAAARNWMLNTTGYKKNTDPSIHSIKQLNHHTNTNKNYDQPL